jgi:hypothetical protein
MEVGQGPIGAVAPKEEKKIYIYYPICLHDVVLIKKRDNFFL